MSSYQQPWFKIGRLEITTTVGVALLGAVGMLVSEFVPELLFYLPQQLLRGEVWRLFTWPLAGNISLGSVLILALLWVFGRDLEAQVGRSRMALLFLGIWGSLTLTTTMAGFVLPGSTIGGLQLVEFCLLLLWIAEWPNRRFFFDLPAWAFGIIMVALQVAALLTYRARGNLLGLLLSLALVAIAARRVGLLGQYSWIPSGRRTKAASRAQHRSGHQPSYPQPSRTQQRHAERRALDDARIDQLLDKINASGIHSLTKRERSELEKLRQRRR